MHATQKWVATHLLRTTALDPLHGPQVKNLWSRVYAEMFRLQTNLSHISLTLYIKLLDNSYYVRQFIEGSGCSYSVVYAPLRDI